MSLSVSIFDEMQYLSEVLDYKYLAVFSIVILAALFVSGVAIFALWKYYILFKSISLDAFIFSSDGKIKLSFCKNSDFEKIKSAFEFGEEFKDFCRLRADEIKGGEKISIESLYKEKKYKFSVEKAPRLFGKNLNMALVVDISNAENANAEHREFENDEHCNVVNESLSFAVKSTDANKTIAKLLEFLGGAMKSDRAFIFLCDKELREIKNTHYWNSKIYADRPFSIKNVPYEKGEPLIEILEKGGVVCFSKEKYDEIKELSALQELHTADGVKSSMIVGFFENNRLAGFIGVDYLGEERAYAPSDGNLLKSFASIAELDMERYRQMKKILEIEEEHRLILDSIHIPIRLFDANANLINLNNAAAESVEKSKEEILRESCASNFCMNKYSDDSLCPVKLAIKERKIVQTKMNIDDRHVIATGVPVFNKAGKLVNVVESDADITEIVEANKKLREAVEVAQASEKAKSFFLDTMSHELRTPLNAILGYSELTKDSSLTQRERLHNLKNITFAANTLLNLINEILDLSKLESEQVEIVKTPMNLSDTMREFTSVFNFSTKKKGIYLKIHMPEEVPWLMMNTIGNAVKFTNLGGIDVEISLDNKTPQKTDLCILVKDSGVGISEEKIPSIFDPFMQSRASKMREKSVYESTGLGLPIVKRLMEQMDGSVTVESAVDKGSVFKLLFSGTEIATESDLKEMELAKSSPASPEVKKVENAVTALVVDDILLNVKVLRNMLQNMGVSVIETLDPLKVSDILRLNRPDIIMTDLWMPKMNGEELAREIKSNPETAEIPVIAVTADAQLKDPNMVFDDVLLKPITMQAISAILEKWVP